MYTDLLQRLGLSKNGARVYEALLRNGELSIGKIATKSGVHRRNVYDVIQRLLEMGLVFEIIETKENRYQAVEPTKLQELIREKENMLLKVLPELERLHSSTPPDQAVYIYKGLEGWKNYMRDIIRTKANFYCIGGKGAWMEERINNFFPQFIRDAKRHKIKFFHLFDSEVRDSKHDIVKFVGKNFKFLPAEYSSSASIDIFGDKINFISNIHLGGVDKDISFTVVTNPGLAEAFRGWFQFMWEHCPDLEKN